MPVVDAEGRCVGIVTEADLMLPDDEGDLHIPHYINLFGGTVFLEPLGRFEERLRKAFASKAEDMMTPDPRHGRARTRPCARRRGLIHDSGHNRLPVVEEGAWSAWSRGWTCSAPCGVSAERPSGRSPRLTSARSSATAPGCRQPLCAVVKADGYGHGAARGRRGRRCAGGAEWLAVATADEAAALRAPGIDVPILVMGALTPRSCEVALDAQADVVAWSDEVAAAAPRVHVKLDTGMGRLGTKDREQALRLAARDNVPSA